MMNRFLPYAHQSISDEDIAAVGSALSGEIITRHEKVAAFEQEVASYCGAAFAVAFNSGTSALIASCYAAELGPNDRLISTANTFIGTISGAFHFGATPVLVDIDRETGSGKIDAFVDTANQKSTRGKSVLIPVHFSGIPFDIQELESHMRSSNFVIIEDAAHALGTSYTSDGPRIGSCAYSHMTVFSFHPAKTITTGEGGMVTTNDERLAQRLRLFRNNGIERDPNYFTGQERGPWVYEVQDISHNYNFTEFQAALGSSQLKKIDRFIEKRRELVHAYREQLKDLPHIRLLTSKHDAYTAFHLFVAQFDFSKLKNNRTKLIDQLKESGIGTQVHYIPLYRHPVCSKRWGDLQEFFPEMEAYYESTLSLPLFYDMTPDDVSRVVEEIKKILY